MKTLSRILGITVLLASVQIAKATEPASILNLFPERREFFGEITKMEARGPANKSVLWLHLENVIEVTNNGKFSIVHGMDINTKVKLPDAVSSTVGLVSPKLLPPFLKILVQGTPNFQMIEFTNSARRYKVSAVGIVVSTGNGTSASITTMNLRDINYQGEHGVVSVLDVDHDGIVSPRTDGYLITLRLRERSSEQIEFARSPYSDQNFSTGDIALTIDGLKKTKLLDVDANGIVEASTDGQLILNYLLGGVDIAPFISADQYFYPGRRANQIRQYLKALIN